MSLDNIFQCFITRDWNSYSFYSDIDLRQLIYFSLLKSKFFADDEKVLLNENDEPVFSIRSKRSVLNILDDILELEYNSNALLIERIDILKHHANLILGNDKYDLFITTGGRFSFFKNDKQIGGIIEYRTKSNENIYIFKTEEYKTFLIQIAMFLIIDRPYDDAFNSLNALYFDTPYVKKHDTEWFLEHFPKDIIPRKIRLRRR